ncbi:MAG: hypothetical protein GF329_02270 [Candidatus Lokiarchaeota archaeon]|nr:hypothetical protein [Candidatus Lokiarchaeota archaeon]
MAKINILSLIGGIISILVIFFLLIYVNMVFNSDITSGFIGFFQPRIYSVSDIIGSNQYTFSISPLYFIISGLIAITGGILGIIGGIKNSKGLKIGCAAASIGAFVFLIIFSFIALLLLKSMASIFGVIEYLEVEIIPMIGGYIPIIGGIIAFIGIFIQKK